MITIFDRVVGPDAPLMIIAGPCAAESLSLCQDVAGNMIDICAEYDLLYVFKASYDKANRSSHESYRGPGIEQGLFILNEIRNIGVPVITDVHEYTPLDEVADVVSMMQTPAFLCRQTDFIQNVARQGIPVNIKKGQFMSPEEMKNVVNKAKATGNENILVCERGFSFGYNNLVSDMRGMQIMRPFAPVIYDATHSVQMPGGLGTSSGGARQFIPTLARAAVGAGVSGVFMETHPNPDQALSDGPNSWPLHKMRELIDSLVAIDDEVKAAGYLEDTL